ncbi:MAG: tetratricopeptide repeat protein [Mariniphaga sp.]
MNAIIWAFGTFPYAIFFLVVLVIRTFLSKTETPKRKPKPFWIILPWVLSLLSHIIVLILIMSQNIPMNGWFWSLFGIGVLGEVRIITTFRKYLRSLSEDNNSDQRGKGNFGYNIETVATPKEGDFNPLELYFTKKKQAILLRDNGEFAKAEVLFLEAENIIHSTSPLTDLSIKGLHCSLVASAYLFELWLAMTTLYTKAENSGRIREYCNKIIETAEHATITVLERFYEMIGKRSSDVREEVALAYRGLAVASCMDSDLDSALLLAQKAYEMCSDDHRISLTLELLQEEAEKRANKKREQRNKVKEAAAVNLNSEGRSDVRVFVSSTFRGLVEERNELALKTFPRLREMCEKRSLIWTAVDLRWGITDDDMNRGDVVPICLEQIERCPYFIGILGERYGTALEALPTSNLIRPEHKWIDEHPEYSITAIEMMHAALVSPPRAQASFFYIKSHELPTEQEVVHNGHNNDRFDPVDLESLKKAIIRSGHPVRFFTSPDELAELVWDDLAEIVESLASDVSSESDGVSQMRRQSRWLTGKANELSISGLVLERSTVSSPIQEMLLGSSGKIIIVSGAVASGKTQTLVETALWAQQSLADTVVLTFFPSSGAFGENPEVAQVLLAEGAAQYGIKEKAPVSEVAKIDFAQWLSTFSKEGRTVIVIDCAGSTDSVLSWIPENIPANVFVVLSALETEGNECTLATRVELIPLSEKERRVYSVDYLRTHGKKLTEEQLVHIAQTPACGLPGFLRRLIDELCLYGEYERFNSYFNSCLKCPDLAQLYHKVLERVHHTFPATEEVLAVNSALCLVEASGLGLAETELLDLLGGRDQLFPQARWQPIALNLRSFLDESTGVLRMHDQFASEIARSLSSDGVPAVLYPFSILIGYFSGRPPSKRRSEMLCYLLRQTESWETLYDVLSGCPDGEHENKLGMKDVSVFRDIFIIDSLGLERCWLAISGNLGKTPMDGYRWILEDPSKHDSTTLFAVAQMLRSFGYKREATRLTAQISDASEELHSFEQLQLAEDKVMGLLATGRVQEALDACSKEISDAETLGDSSRMADYLLLRGKVFMGVQRAQEAMTDMKKYETIKLKEKDSLGLMTAHFNLAHCCNMLFRNDEAISHLDEYDSIAKKTKHVELELEAKYIRSISLHGKQDYTECLRVCDEYIEHAEKYCSEERLINILGVKGVCLRAMGKPEEGLIWMRRQEAICRKVNDTSNLASCLNNIANTLAALGKYDEATVYFEEELSIAESTGNPVRIVQNLIYQSRMFMVGGFQSEAAERLIKAHEKAIQLGVIISEVVHDDSLVQLSKLASRVGLPQNWRQCK